MADAREAQVAIWTAMRRGGKLRYVAVRGLKTGAGVALGVIGATWIKTGILTLTLEAVMGFIVAGLISAAWARSEWDKLASVYPDIGIDRDNADR